MKAVGGEIGSASALAPKLGPLGLVRLKLHSGNIDAPNLHNSLSNFYAVAEEGRWGHSESNDGLERDQSHSETECCQPRGMRSACETIP